jgi:hypothetical protein
VQLEEIGHSIDHRLNDLADSQGDEGELFSLVLIGELIDGLRSDSILMENDHAQLLINGADVPVEL